MPSRRTAGTGGPPPAGGIHGNRAPGIRFWLALAAAFVCVQVAALALMGHPAICACGHVALWHGNASDAENSQHLTDWYTFSHVIHGLGFYLLLWLVAPRAPLVARFAIAIGIEAGWEIVENTPWIIDRYRQTALAQGYFGDSVVNSVSDTLAAALGFAIARRAPVWASVLFVVAAEIFVGYTIHDNLTLNIIQLIWPVEAISRWQAGG